jgi:hypothetical protein
MAPQRPNTGLKTVTSSKPAGIGYKMTDEDANNLLGLVYAGGNEPVRSAGWKYSQPASRDE